MQNRYYREMLNRFIVLFLIVFSTYLIIYYAKERNQMPQVLQPMTTGALRSSEGKLFNINEFMRQGHTVNEK